MWLPSAKDPPAGIIPFSNPKIPLIEHQKFPLFFKGGGREADGGFLAKGSDGIFFSAMTGLIKAWKRKL
jgi:hypothetical protein